MVGVDVIYIEPAAASTKNDDKEKSASSAVFAGGLSFDILAPPSS